MAEKITFAPLSYTGWGSLAYLLQEVQRFEAQNVLIVTDPFLKDLGLTDTIERPLAEAGISAELYMDIVPEPPLEVGEKLVAYMREYAFDLVIGLGGGSALDLAKLAGVLAVHEGKVADYLN